MVSIHCFKSIFLHENHADKETLLKKMAQQLYQKDFVPQDFYDSVKNEKQSIRPILTSGLLSPSHDLDGKTLSRFSGDHS